AKQLHLTQPAVSKRIANLEAQLGCSLFDRIGRQISLTQAGNALLPKARSILQQIQGVVRLMDDISGNITGQLSIATSHHIGIHRLPPILRNYTEQYPQVALDLHFLDSEQIVDEVLKGHYDLAVATLPVAAHLQMVSEPVWRDEMCVVVNPQHSLAAKSVVSLTDLSQVNAILPDRLTATYQSVKTIFEQHKVGLEKHQSINNLDAIRMMIEVGLGWGVLPKTLVNNSLCTLDLRHGNLKNKDLRHIEFSRTLGYLHHRQRSLSKAAMAFIELLAANPRVDESTRDCS
ncbi:MAG: LysR family transcriptional regulator, partial [Algicola sp.]|nr:LysR family transcriptional regulator [Algicola sp.]